MLTAKGRGHKSHKAWIALFIFLSTKAVHLELVNDYASDAFITAFKRFVSRRGINSDINSDCDSFSSVGVNIKLKAEKFQAMRIYRGGITKKFADQTIHWHFMRSRQNPI